MTIRVTTTPTHLDQLHHIGIVNETGNPTGKCWYRVEVDGVYVGRVEHAREDGAIALVSRAMNRARLTAAKNSVPN